MNKKIFSLLLSVICIMTFVFSTSYADTSFINVKASANYDGSLHVSGKLFGCGGETITLKAVRETAEDSLFEIPAYVGEIEADKNGYFSLDFSVNENGKFVMFAAAPSRFARSLKSETFEAYSYKNYTDAWETVNGDDENKISREIENIIKMFVIDGINRDVFDVNDYLSHLLAEHDSFGEYTVENINKFKEYFTEAFVISGFQTETDVTRALSEYKDEMSLSEVKYYDEYEKSNDRTKSKTAEFFANSRSDSMKSYDDIKSCLADSIKKALVDNVFYSIANVKNYSALTDVISNKTNVELLEITDNEISSYLKNKDKVNKKLAGTSFDKVSEFKKAFLQALNSEGEKIPSSMTGGSGGGGTIHVDTPKVEVNTENSGTNDIVPSNKDCFSDLTGHEWAKKEIEFLYKMGIVNGREEGKFIPAETVLREEYVKLLVSGFEIPVSEGTAAFADVAENSWFAPYVTVAKNNGIVFGDGKYFGTGNAVTRQDLCAMTVRALKAMGYKTKGETPSFKDSADIADYAHEAVAFLEKEGIVSGMLDGTFMPLKNATRAEASCIIYRLLDYVKKNQATLWKSVSPSLDSVPAPSEEKVLKDIKEMIKTKKHPYIHATTEKLDFIKTAVKSGKDEYVSLMYENVKQEANNYLKQPVYAHNGMVSQSIADIEQTLLDLMVTYYVEEDERYLNRALAEFENLKGITKWTAAAQLDNTQTASTLALYYDWLYDHLTQEQREWAENTIKTKCLDIAYRYYKNPSELETLRNENDHMNIWCWRGSYNHCIYNNSNLLVCALAIAPEYPEYSAFIMANNIYNVQPYLELVGENGGQAEPVGYYGYTTGKICNMLSALQSSLGTMYDYDRYPGFRTTAYYPLYMHGVGSLVFGDTSPVKSTPSSNSPLYFFAKYSKNSELLSVIVKRYKLGVMSLLWYDEGEMNNIDENTELPLDRVIYPSTKTQNVASFRDSWDTENSLFAGMYVGCATANGHSDASSGVFGIDVYGERFVTAIGLGNYDYPGYWDQSEGGGRWDWYEKRAEGANALVINPSASPGQSLKANAVMNGFETAAGGGFAWSDLTSVYGDYVTSYKRGIKLYDNRSKVIIQDEAVMKAPSEIFWSINTPAKTEIIDKNTAVMSIGDKKLAMKVYANVDFDLYEMAAEKLPTSPQRAEQRVYRTYRKLAISAKNVSELKLMVEFVPYIAESDFPTDMTEWTDIDKWTADKEMNKKPEIEGISVNGEPLAGFANKKYVYEIEYETLPESVPSVDIVHADDINVIVTYPDMLPGKIIITAERGSAHNNYEINIKKEPRGVKGMTKFGAVSAKANVDDGNVPENVLDGNLNTRWSASGVGATPMLDVDLGTVRKVNVIGIGFYEGAKRKSYFDILISVDGTNWTQIMKSAESSGTSSELEYFDVGEVSARYFRYVGYGNSLNEWNSVTEMAFFSE